VSTILTVIGGGIAGSALTYGLTWLRERRRTTDAYRAPQRAAIGEISAATYELTMRVFAWRDELESLANEGEGKPDRTIDGAHQEDTFIQVQRALLGVQQAFQIGRLTVVDAECYEAMGEAFYFFTKLGGALSGYDELTPTAETPTAENLLETLASIVTFVRDLNRYVVTLVEAGQKRLSPMQTWVNKRRRAAVTKRLDAKYFTPPGRVEGPT
jgi:hypothetical protein